MESNYFYLLFVLCLIVSLQDKMIPYIQIILENKKIIQNLEKKNIVWSWIRIILIVTIIYLFYLMLYRKESSWGYIAVGLSVVFFVVVHLYLKLQKKIKYHKILLDINQKEVAFLKGEHQFDGGEEFIDPSHSYSYDLDLFGKNSIFQFINRTSTYLGKKTLVSVLLKSSSIKEIEDRQASVNELSDKLNFRQNFQTLSVLSESMESTEQTLKLWVDREDKSVPFFYKIAATALPLLFAICSGLYALDYSEKAGTWCMYLFIFNLLVFGMLSKRVLNEINSGSKIANTIKNYALMIKTLETESFTSEGLQNIQNKLKNSKLIASQELNKLGAYYEKLDTIANIFVNLLLNGVFQYHFWVYTSLLSWKKQHKASLWSWIECIGEVEALNSFANYAANNPEYIYPKIDVDAKKIKFGQLGHPLISKEKRVRNTIEFTDKSFVILTGSNMSGKSTFLRTVGLNLVMSASGMPIDASEAVFYPFPLWVSMRLTDSLSDSESFFFAEVKRLQKITQESEKHEIFILLDEILKGTNSEDKKLGTIGVIERLHQNKVRGMIATHDLEVCNVADKYSESMENKRFEVEIVNDELVFDYQLKNGICENKNATFIMKQMGII